MAAPPFALARLLKPGKLWYQNTFQSPLQSGAMLPYCANFAVLNGTWRSVVPPGPSSIRKCSQLELTIAGLVSSY